MNPTDTPYALPSDLAEDIDRYAGEVDRFLKGELAPALLKAKRVPRGVYEQRRDGTFMVRVRIAGGVVTATQCRELAALAGTFGNGQLHVTTRQDLQLHDVAIVDTPTVMRRLLQVGLTSKGGGGNTVRNVSACPYAGVCPAERFDVTPFAQAVTEYLIGLVGSYNLPRKYKIAFSGCGADCALSRFCDLGFVARMQDGVPGFAVYAGGGMGLQSRIGDSMAERIDTREVIRVAESVRRLFDRMGDRQNRNRARLRFVFDRMGVDAFRQALTETLAQVPAEGVPACNVTAEPHQSPAGIENAPARWQTRTAGGLRIFAQRQPGLVAVELALPLGFLPSTDLLLLADVAETFSAEKGLRTTRAQDLLIRSVREQDVPALEKALRGLTTDVVSATPLERFVACAGASTCRLGLCLARDAARACASALAAAGLDATEPLLPNVNISGCPNACGQHPAAEVGLFGSTIRFESRLVPAYKVVLGACHQESDARLGDPAGLVPARALPSFLVELLNGYRSERAPGERFSMYFRRKDLPYFQEMVQRHSAIPGYTADPTYYRDWGCDEDFSLAGRGAGECGAGVFEVIGEDIRLARKSLKEAQENAGDVLFAALLPTVRALIITRGVDTADPGAIFRAFEQHFVDTGLVSSEARALLDRGRGYLQGWREALAGQKAAVESLLNRVELLFSTLDANLVFHPPQASEARTTPPAPAKTAPPAAPSEAQSAIQQLDLRGVACPMNFVKAKLRLEKMALGQTLDVLLDDGEPIRNVPASMRDQGQEVVETVLLPENCWRLRLTRRK